MSGDRAWTLPEPEEYAPAFEPEWEPELESPFADMDSSSEWEATPAAYWQRPAQRDFLRSLKPVQEWQDGVALAYDQYPVTQLDPVTRKVDKANRWRRSTTRQNFRDSGEKEGSFCLGASRSMAVRATFGLTKPTYKTVLTGLKARIEDAKGLRDEAAEAAGLISRIASHSHSKGPLSQFNEDLELRYGLTNVQFQSADKAAALDALKKGARVVMDVPPNGWHWVMVARSPDGKLWAVDPLRGSLVGTGPIDPAKLGNRAEIIVDSTTRKPITPDRSSTYEKKGQRPAGSGGEWEDGEESFEPDDEAHPETAAPSAVNVTLPVQELIALWDATAGLNERVRRMAVQLVNRESPAASTEYIDPLTEGEAASFVPLVAEESDEADDAREAWLGEEWQETESVELEGENEYPELPARPEIILVAGVDYPKFAVSGGRWVRKRELSPGPWREFCLRMARERLRTDRALKVTLFDFLRGTREDVSLDGKQRVVTTVEVTFAPPVVEDYRNLVGIDTSNPNPLHLATATLEPVTTNSLPKKPQIHYFDGANKMSAGKSVKLMTYLGAANAITPKVISITDVYAYIEGFVRAGKRAMLREVHFFAHAFNSSLDPRYSGGPILLNTLDNPLSADRVVADKDARAGKDFRQPAMNPSIFAQAFRADAKSFVWGCNFQQGFIRQLVNEIGKNRQILAAGKPMKVRHTADWGTVKDFRSRLGLSASAPVVNVSVDPLKVEQIVQAVNQSSYMQKFATASNRPVVGAPPGTYSDFDGGRSPLELLHVPMTKDPFREDNVTFENALSYFKDGLKLPFDKSFGDHKGLGRGFIIFDP